MERTTITASNLLSLIAKPFANVDDVCMLAECGKCRAYEIIRDIQMDITRKGKRLPRCTKKAVPMQMVIDYLEIDEERILKFSKIEKEII